MYILFSFKCPVCFRLDSSAGGGSTTRPRSQLHPLDYIRLKLNPPAKYENFFPHKMCSLR